MNIEQLQLCRSERIDGETISQTWERLSLEGKFCEEDIPETQEQRDLSFDDDFIIPRLKVVQPQCRIEGASAGSFRNMLTEEETDSLEDVVFLIQQNSRTLFPDDDFSGGKRCYSFNGYYPASDIKDKTGLDPISSQCAYREGKKVELICPLAQWRNRDTKQPDPKGTLPPPCKTSISFLGLETKGYLPFWIIFHGSALPVLKDFLRYVGYKKIAAERQGQTLELYHFKLILALSLQTTARGKYYIPMFQSKEIIEDQEQRTSIFQCYENLKDRFLSDPLVNNE